MSKDIINLLNTVSQHEVKDICRPLFESFNFSLFIYTRVYSNNTYWTLSNRADWVEYFYREKYIVPNKEDILGRYCINICDLNIPNKQILTARNVFNTDNWINIFETNKNYYDIFAFATPRKVKKDFAINLYNNQTHLLEHFVIYFKEKAKKLIEHAEKNKTRCANTTNNKTKNSKIFYTSKKHDQFLEKTGITKFYLSNEYDDEYLTKREIESITLLTCGFSIKKIGKIIGISSRTVDFYLTNIKKKLNCVNNDNLIYIFNNSNLKNYKSMVLHYMKVFNEP